MHIIAPHLSCVVNAPIGDNTANSEFDQAVAAGYSEIYVVGHTGIVKYHKLRGEGRFVTVKVDKIPGVKLHDIGENFDSFLPAGPVPHRLLQQIEAFFRQVMAVHNNALEAMIWVLYNPQQGYFLHVPDQRISKASVSYDWDDVPSGSSIVVDIHSHNTMGAFFSGTDNNDDKAGIRFSGVFGNLQNATPSTVWRFNYMDKKFEAKIEDIFEAPPAEDVEVPKEWMGRVKVTTPVALHNVTRVSNPVAPREYPYTTPTTGHTRGKGVGRGTRHNFYPEVEFQGQFWGFDENDENFDRMITRENNYLYGNTESDAAERRMAWESMLSDVDERNLDEDAVRPVRGMILSDEEEPVGQGALYEAMAQLYGPDVADAYDAIDGEMLALEGQDELLGTLTGEMVGLIKDDSVKLDIIRSVYEGLSREAREKLQTNGL